MINNVLLVKIEGPIWYTIYYHLPVVKGVNKPLYSPTNQWEFGTSMDMISPRCWMIIRVASCGMIFQGD